MTTTPNRRARQQRALGYLLSLVALAVALGFIFLAVRQGNMPLAVVGGGMASVAGAMAGRTR
jgi:hypothetical protein